MWNPFWTAPFFSRLRDGKTSSNARKCEGALQEREPEELVNRIEFWRRARLSARIVTHGCGRRACPGVGSMNLRPNEFQ